jgi:K+-sensing histidine kinase KdpD
VSQLRADHSDRHVVFRNVAVAIASVVIATLLSFPLRMMFDHSRGLLLIVAIMFSAWYGGMRAGILASILTAISFTVFFNDQHGIAFSLYAITRLLVYSAATLSITYLMAQRKHALVDALEANQQLEKALEEIRVLRGILPICMHCKQIRDGEGSWQQVEQYIASQTEAKFSHSVCPECMEKFYPEVRKSVR